MFLEIVQVDRYGRYISLDIYVAYGLFVRYTKVRGKANRQTFVYEIDYLVRLDPAYRLNIILQISIAMFLEFVVKWNIRFAFERGKNLFLKR